MASLAFALWLAGSLQVEPGTPEPEPVVNGTDALVCEFPAVASAIRVDGSVACTVAVVHPRVMMLAAHCLYSGELDRIVFGESAFAPTADLQIEECQAHPMYADIDDFNYFDLAFCTVTSDAPAVPIVPPLMGCEAEQLVPGASVVLPGFGMNDEVGLSGHGIKRWTINTVESVDELNNDLYLLGIDGASVCYGDSGGPAYLQLADGTWRIVGVTSEGHPDTEGMEYICGYGAIYDLVHLEMEWLELASGFDLTPCFDADGTWNADESCGAFPTSLTAVGLDWTTACATKELGDWSATCGEPFMAAGSSSGGADTGDESTGDATVDDTTGAPPPPPDTTTGGEALTGSTSATIDLDSSESTGPADQDGDEGCGCSTRSRASGLLLLLMIPALRRRRAGARGSCTTPRDDRH